jgi:flagellar biosynthesis protein FlhG
LSEQVPLVRQNEQTCYEILEVAPGASDDEIRRALKRAKEVYSKDSMVVYTLFTEAELEQLNQRIEEAYETVIDPRKRREYNLSLAASRDEAEDDAPGGALFATRDDRSAAFTPPPAPPDVPESLPPGVELGGSLVFTGDMLRSIREHKGVDLRDVGERTKISLMNLRYIEAMQFDQMQAPVYVRGFLREYAKYLKLPEKQVVDTYMEVHHRSLGEITEDGVE